MARESYDMALTRLLTHEGGYGNHPSDPGGPTNYGITLADYRRYINASATAADVRAMRVEDAKAIYRAHYWNALRCDELPAGLDYAVFDFGVNSGVSRSAKYLQRLVEVPADGNIGDVTLAAVRKRDPADTAARLCDERLAFLKGLKTWPVFGAGWGRRVREVRAQALILARSAARPVTPATTPVRPGLGWKILSALWSLWRPGRPRDTGNTGACGGHESCDGLGRPGRQSDRPWRAYSRRCARWPARRGCRPDARRGGGRGRTDG